MLDYRFRVNDPGGDKFMQSPGFSALVPIDACSCCCRVRPKTGCWGISSFHRDSNRIYGEQCLQSVFLMALTGLLAGTGFSGSNGKECAGIAFPEQVAVGNDTLTLNGLGLRQATLLKVDVYVAAFYVTKTSDDASAILRSNTPKEIILHFIRDVDRSDLVKAWGEGFENNAGGQLPVLAERVAAFKDMMVDMEAGQQMRLVHAPATGIHVEVKGTLKGTVKGDDFAQALFSIWLGRHPPNADLKAGLPGSECG